MKNPSYHWLLLVISVTAVLAAFPNISQAVQIYSLYGKDCQVLSGAIIGVDDTSADVLTFGGAIRRMPVKEIQLVARYDILENPFPRVTPAVRSPAMLRVTSESSEGTFSAYATDFFEDLVLFLDSAGKIRVVEMKEIVSLTFDDTKNLKDTGLPFLPARLISPPGREHCPPVESGAVRGKAAHDRVATLVMADIIRIDSHWQRMRTGYRSLESLRERTLFYARPVMFDQKTRLGIVATRSNYQETLELQPLPWDTLPLYLEFGSGAAYRFQGSTSLGMKSWRMLPQVRPTAGWRSEFKSHLLHGMFLANLSGFTAGKALYDQTTWNPDPKHHRHGVWAQSSFNHLTLLGGDYGSWSASYGYYFPNFAFGQREEFREVTSSRASQVWRVGYLASQWGLELFFFNTHMEGEAFKEDDIDENLATDIQGDFSGFAGEFVRTNSQRNIPLSARLASTSGRAAFTLFLPYEMQAAADLVLTRTTYKETALFFEQGFWGPKSPDSGVARLASSREVINKIAQSQWSARVWLRMDLGQWVALAGEASLEHSRTEGGFEGNTTNSEKTDQIHTYGAALELLL